MYYYNSEKNKVLLLVVVYHTLIEKSMEDTLHMKKFSLTEFKEYCERIQPKQFLFSSEYQPDNSPLGLELTFLQSYIFASVFLAPNSIAFRNNKQSQLVFEGVKYVNIIEEADECKTVCEIVCNNTHSRCCDAIYVIVIV